MVKVLERVVVAIFNLMKGVIESFEDSETPKAGDAWASAKTSVFEPVQTSWGNFQELVLSIWFFADSLVSDFWMPTFDWSVAVLKAFIVQGLTYSIEVGYQIDIALLRIMAPFIDRMKPWPVVGDIIKFAEGVATYMLLHYSDMDLEDIDGEAPMAYTKDGKPATKTFFRSSGGTEKGKPEMSGRASLRPESASLPID